MIAVYRRNTYIGILGIPLAVVFIGMASLFFFLPLTNVENIAPLLYFFALISNISFLWGMYSLAKAKGYSGWYWLLGFLGLIGLVVLILFKDKKK